MARTHGVDWEQEYIPYGTRRDFAAYLRSRDHSYTAVAKQLTSAFGEYVSENAVRFAVKPRRTGESPVVVPNLAPPQFPDKVDPDTDWRSLLERAIERGEDKEKSRYWQDRALVTIGTDEPVIVIHSADWHLGSLATDHAMFKAHIDRVLGTQGVYMITCGDEAEQRGQFQSILPTLFQSLDPTEQVWLLEGLWKALTEAGKLLCCTWGNHTEEQHEKIWGFSPIADIKRREIPYFRGAGYLTLKVGQVEYQYRLNHQDWFNSVFNETHSARQAARVARDCVDIMVNAHIHSPAMQTGQDEHGQWIAVRCGTFKTDDDYSQRHFKQGVFAAPCVVLHPDCKKMVPCWTLDDALTYIEGWRKQTA